MDLSEFTTHYQSIIITCRIVVTYVFTCNYLVFEVYAYTIQYSTTFACLQIYIFAIVAVDGNISRADKPLSIIYRV